MDQASHLDDDDDSMSLRRCRWFRTSSCSRSSRSFDDHDAGPTSTHWAHCRDSRIDNTCGRM